MCVSVLLNWLSGMQSACVVLYCHLWSVCANTLYQIIS